MCIAVVKPAGKWLTRKQARNCFAHNTDGAGFAWVDGGRVHVVKGYFGFRKFWKDFRKVQQYNCLVHFRIRTHGKTDAANCHPFLMCDGKAALIHNGIITTIDTPTGESDTANFVSTIVEPLIEAGGVDILQLDDINEMLASVLGRFNKCATLDDRGRYSIVNQDAGEWEDGMWFSNSGYKTPKTNYAAQYQSRTYNGPGYPSHHYEHNGYGSYVKVEDDYESVDIKPKATKKVATKKIATKKFTKKMANKIASNLPAGRKYKVTTGVEDGEEKKGEPKVSEPRPSKNILLDSMLPTERRNVEEYEEATHDYLTATEIIEYGLIGMSSLRLAIDTAANSRTALLELD